MTAVTIVIWLAAILLAVYAVRKQPDIDRKHQAKLLIIGGAVPLRSCLLYF